MPYSRDIRQNQSMTSKKEYSRMNGNAELLNFIYQNSQMGVDTLKQLLEISKEEQFNRCLKEQYVDYEAIHTKAKELLNSHGLDEKGLSKFEELKTYLMLNMQTLTNQSSSHIAEMLIIGSNMGIIDSIKKQKEYPNAQQNILDLMKTLQNLEERNVEKLKSFL